MRCRHDSGCRKRAHFSYTSLLQRQRTRSERRTRGHHVVDHDHNGVEEAACLPSCHERMPDVAVTLGSWKHGLRVCRPYASQRVHDRQVEASRQVVCLIESPLTTP
jgi:hypothetical protein